jgi:hypothetical protein
MNNFTKFLYTFIIATIFIVATAFGQCPPSTWSLDITVNPDQYPEETTWHLITFNGDTLLEGGPYTNIVDYEPQYSGICLPVDSFLFVLNDQYGDGIAGSLWGGNDGSVYIEQCGDTIWSLPVADFGYQIFDTIYTSGCPPPPPVFGCMDSSYVEFDLTATLDTGMCFTPRVYGCTDSLAYNYIDSANTDINIDSCMHELELTDLAGNGWAGSSLKLSQATSMTPPFNYQVIGTYTLLDGFDTTFFVNLAAGYPVRAVFEITQQSDFTAVQCGYSLYNADFDDGSCVTLIVLGCMDSTAYNYDPAANVELPGSCIPFVYGCMDPVMFNYDPLATASDTCIPYIYGCTDASMFNYNINANTDNGSCIAFIYGCTDSTMYNYDVLANTDNNSCIPFIYGCTDVNAINYNILANTDDGTCIDVVLGCTDSTAFNYNVLANTDDGSCTPVVWGCTDPTAFNYNTVANTDDGSCIPVLFGCIDPTMWNYCDTCNTDNGSCIPYYYGCTDSTALNYDDNANTNNGSCIYPLPGCTDATAINYNPLANVADSSCYYSAGCNVGDVYYIPNACFEWVIQVDPYCCDNTWDATCDVLYTYCVDGWSGPTNIAGFERLGILPYPNPSTGVVNFKVQVNVKVYDMLGKLVLEDETNKIELNKGIYLIKISKENLNLTTKIIIQ